MALDPTVSLLEKAMAMIEIESLLMEGGGTKVPCSKSWTVDRIADAWKQASGDGQTVHRT